MIDRLSNAGDDVRQLEVSGTAPGSVDLAGPIKLNICIIYEVPFQF